MKNFLKICACFMCIFVFSGCKKTINKEGTNINTDINSKATINCGGKKYEADIVHVHEGTTTLTFTSPENLLGTVFTWNGDKYEVSRKELVGEFTNEPFANERFPSNFVKILSILGDTNNVKEKGSKEGEIVYEGKIDGEDFDVTIDNFGHILMIEIPHQELSVNFG